MPHTIQHDLDLWEIWVEYDQFHPEYFGTLYVHGEVAGDRKSVAHFSKRELGCEGQLVLQLPERSSSLDYTNEVLYSEPVRNLNQYTSICIYAGNELIGCFHDIEIMI